MRRTTIALLAALEAAVTALIGLGIVLVPLMLLWAMQYGLAVDATVFLRAAADVWLLGHGVDLIVQLDPVTAGGIGLPGAGEPFPITIALLGFALLSVAAGRRIGRRSAAGGHSITGSVAAVVVYAVVGGTLALVAGADVARASVWQATLLPAFIVAIGVAIGAVAETLREPSPTDAAGGFFRDRLGDSRAARSPPSSRPCVSAWRRIRAPRVAGVFVAVLITLDYATIAGLSQSLGAGVDGSIALVIAQLAFLPNLVVWIAAWMLGPGFALGAGTTVAPGGTLLGPVPGIPLLGALPGAAPLFGVLWLLVPVLAAFVGAWLVQGERRDGWPGAGPVARDRAVVVVADRGRLGVRSWPGSSWGCSHGGRAAPSGRPARGGRVPRCWAVAGIAAVTVGIGSIARRVRGPGAGEGTECQPAHDGVGAGRRPVGSRGAEARRADLRRRVQPPGPARSR